MNKNFYENANARAERELSALAKAHNRASLTRLVCFLLTLSCVIFGVTEKLNVLYGFGTAFFVVFIFFVRKHVEIEKQQGYQSARKTAAGRYLARYGDGWRSFGDDGAQFLSELFPQGKDLDIFGKNSLFQYLCTAQTERGRAKLADRLSNPKPGKADTEKHQGAVRELGDKREFVLHVESLGISATTGRSRPELIEDFLNLAQTPQKKTPLPLVVFAWGFPALTLTFLVLTLVGVNRDFNMAAFTASFTFALACAYVGQVRNGKILTPLESFAEQIGAYSDMLRAIEYEPFDNAFLCELQDRLKQNEGATAALSQLKAIYEAVTGRRNVFGFMLLNGLLLWDFHLTDRFLIWREKYGTEVEAWLNCIGEFEMLSSLSVLCNVKEQICFPTIVTSKTPVISFVSAKHPLIAEQKAVGNSLELSACTCVITGSNMSGKTTFLRTVGINLLLAYAGAPVMAGEFEASEMALRTSIRIEDSVTDGVSAFYAELLRLREIVEYHKKEMPMVILIDEIFKGTNSADRITGARETIRRLSGDRTITLFTTHDFELCALENESGIHAANYHFEEGYEGDKILFDYKIRSGRCKTTNAQYLLKMTGII